LKLTFKDESVIVYDDAFEVHIQKKIFGGYTLKKYKRGSLFDLIESRDSCRYFAGRGHCLWQRTPGSGIQERGWICKLQSPCHIDLSSLQQHNKDNTSG